MLADAVPTWKTGVPPPGWQSTRWIRIPRFGIDRFYQGGLDDDGVKHADRLYAALEAAARAGPDTIHGMFVELFVQRENERAIRFWQRQGFQDIGTSEGDRRYRRFFRYPWDDANPGT